MSIRSLIRTIPDYPKPGIQFRDITTLLNDPDGLRLAVDGMAERYQGESIEVVVGIEARGFIFGAAVAYRLGLGFVPLRKSGKLPGATLGRDFELEYGHDRIELHEGAIEPGANVLLVDDLIATGGDRGGRGVAPAGGPCRGFALCFRRVSAGAWRGGATGGDRLQGLDPL